MKKTRRLVSLLLAALLLTVGSLPGTAANAWPESEHHYKNNTDQTWEYVHPGHPEQLFVTFSEKTYLIPSWYYYDYLSEEEMTEETLRELAENGYFTTNDDDRLFVYDNTGALYGSYTADELAGATLLLPGDRFTLRLVTDEAGTDYGFSIDRIAATLPENTAIVNYRFDDAVHTLIVPANEPIALNSAFMLRQDGSRMLVGWRTEDGRAWNYVADRWSRYGTETDLVAEAGAVYDLYPVYCPIGLTADEVYSFTNDDYTFNDGYYYTNGDYFRNIGNWLGTFTVTPFMPVAAAGLAYLSVYWPTYSFMGSCCGFPVTELLQHYGKIDLLSAQGVSSVSELEPTEELTSIINVYNNNCVACHLVNNVGIDPGTEEYTAQLKKLYETLEQGTPVYFEFYPYGQHPMKTIATLDAESAADFLSDLGAHGILLTGAYTADDGSHVIIACDCNSSAYSYGGCDTLVIDKDFTQIDYIDSYGVLYGFSWNDDVSQFDSFKLTGVSNPFAWHIAFIRHFLDTFRQILAMFMKNLPARRTF